MTAWARQAWISSRLKLRIILHQRFRTQESFMLVKGHLPDWGLPRQRSLPGEWARAQRLLRPGLEDRLIGFARTEKRLLAKEKKAA
jgi:hypothetical protein